MAEGFESSYHVPQQSRRDKLRVGGGGEEVTTVTPAVAAAALNLHHHHNNHQHAGLLPLYDPSSLLPSDLLTCANNQVKEENNPSNLMGFVGGSGISTIPSSSSSSSTSHHHHHHQHHGHGHQSPYVDPNTSLPLNPSPIQDINNSTNTGTTTTNTNTNNNPFFYSIHNHQLGDVVVYKPEPLSLTHHHHHHQHHHESSSNASGQGLSLSLSSHDTNNLQNNNQNILPLELNLQRYGSAGDHHGGYMIPGIFGGGGSTSNEVSRCPVPLGPFTGYASILKGSRFLKPAQILLEELCDVVGRGIYTEKAVPDPSLMDPSVEGLGEGCVMEEGALCRGEDSEFSRKKSRLISMLNEVCRRYKHYFQQMQAVATSFEYVAGLGNAAPYANLALKTMSKHFRCLKTAISDQLQFTNKACGQGVGHKKDESSKFSDRINFSQRPQHSAGYLDHQPVWRPQRGLPECAVTVLRAWLFDHFLHPYPTDTDKLMLAKQTGLSRSQVSNWFINARVRLWKPMVEEIHMLETQQAQKGSEREEHHINRSIDPPPLANSNATEIPSTSTQVINDSPAKRTRSELPIVPIRNEDALHLSYNNLSGPPHVNVGEGIGGISNGVSLTLGLHQNDNQLALSEPYPINAMHRFGLGIEGNNEGYVLGGFETQERHFGRDVYGGQLLHDFVG